MIIPEPLNQEQRHLLHLVNRSSDKDGWAKCSIPIWLLTKNVPPELLERKVSQIGGMARLTTSGQAIVKYV